MLCERKICLVGANWGEMGRIQVEQFGLDETCGLYPLCGVCGRPLFMRAWTTGGCFLAVRVGSCCPRTWRD